MLGSGIDLSPQAVRAIRSAIAGGVPTLDLSMMFGALDSRVTFTRASVGTYTDSAGAIQTAGVNAPRFDHAITATVTNLLLRSSEFSDAVWTKGAASVAPDAAAAPDGSVTADKLTETATTAVHTAFQSVAGFVSGTTYTWSVYARPEERTQIRLTFGSSTAFPTERGSVFDLANGVLGAAIGSASATIQAVGGGWYRCAVTATAEASGPGSAVVRLFTGVSSYAGVAGWGVYLWGAQVEAGSGAMIAVQTGASAATGYETAGLGLLIEEARTNGVAGDLTNASYWNFGGVATALGETAPDGGTTGVLMTTGGSTAIYGAVNVTAAAITASNITTGSIFAKAGTSNWVRLVLGNASTPTTGAQAWFNLLTGTVGTVNINAGTPTSITTTIQNCGNGWYRCGISAILGTATTGFMLLRSASADSSTTDNANRTVRWWGPQIEAGFLTSYIPTTTTATTRATDVAAINTLSPWFNAAEGVLMVEASRPVFGANYPWAVSFDDGTGLNRMGILQNDATDDTSGALVRTANVTQVQRTGPVMVMGTAMRAALAYKLDDFAYSVNGGAVSTDLTGTLPTVTRMVIGNGDNNWCGHIRRIRYYASRLDNATLQGLTS